MRHGMNNPGQLPRKYASPRQHPANQQTAADKRDLREREEELKLLRSIDDRLAEMVALSRAKEQSDE